MKCWLFVILMMLRYFLVTDTNWTDLYGGYYKNTGDTGDVCEAERALVLLTFLKTSQRLIQCVAWRYLLRCFSCCVMMLITCVTTKANNSDEFIYRPPPPFQHLSDTTINVPHTWILLKLDVLLSHLEHVMKKFEIFSCYSSDCHKIKRSLLNPHWRNLPVTVAQQF